METLKAYQVGENDIIAAYNEKQAIEILCEYNGCIDVDDFDHSDVTKLSFCLKLQDEEGQGIGTLGSWLAQLSKPEYMYGWE